MGRGLGCASIVLQEPVYIEASASVVGTKEGQGPLGILFDLVGKDDLFGAENWEEAESRLQKEALFLALKKAGRTPEEIKFLFAGDLLGQSIASSFEFLVSLALALGLAGMNDSGLSVDMLLIDEGFGTLSGEHLNSAIEALESLNALTGTRKVGVISHVERLRERIKTHVEVKRNGHEPSTVKVVSA